MMTFRSLVIAWSLAAMMLCLGVVAALKFTPDDQPTFRDADVAMIGSSLVRNGFPYRGTREESIFPDGRSHQRVGVGNISERDVLLLAAKAIEDNVRIILIEINPLIRDFAGMPMRFMCRDWSRYLRIQFKQYQLRVAAGTRIFIGRDVMTEPPEPDLLTVNSSSFDPKVLSLIFPFRIHQPYCKKELNQLLDAAREKNVQIIFFLPPRSVSGEKFMGQDQAREFFEMAQQVTRQMNAKLFMPSGPWPDHEFSDHAHVNQLGREHLLRELRIWWQSQP